MAYGQLRFGATYLPTGFAAFDDAAPRDIMPVKLPRTDGSRLITAYQGDKSISVRGMFVKGPISNLGGASTIREAVDTLRDLLASGPQSLYLHNDRCYRDCQGTLSVSYLEGRYESFATVDMQFTTGDPFQYSGNATVDTWSSPSTGNTRVVTPAGNAYVLPQYRFIVGGAGSQTFNYRLTNSTTGKYFTLGGTVTGGSTIVVDTRAKTVTIAGADNMSLFEGEFIVLNDGANTLTITITLGTITSITTIWADRWWG